MLLCGFSCLFSHMFLPQLLGLWPGWRKERKEGKSLSKVTLKVFGCVSSFGVPIPAGGGPQRKPPKKKGGRAGSNTHIHTLFSFKMCACQCLSCRYSVEIFDILSWFADTVGTCRLYKTEVWLPIFLHALDPSNSQKYPGKGTSFPDLMGSGLGGPSPEETYKVWRQCFTCNDLSLSWVLN